MVACTRRFFSSFTFAPSLFTLLTILSTIFLAACGSTTPSSPSKTTGDSTTDSFGTPLPKNFNTVDLRVTSPSTQPVPGGALTLDFVKQDKNYMTQVSVSCAVDTGCPPDVLKWGIYALGPNGERAPVPNWVGNKDDRGIYQNPNQIFVPVGFPITTIQIVVNFTTTVIVQWNVTS